MVAWKVAVPVFPRSKSMHPRENASPHLAVLVRVQNTAQRHLGCRCCTEFRQTGVGGVVINAMLPRRHCLTAQKMQRFTSLQLRHSGTS